MSRIEDYALIGDLQTAALVGVDGSIDWMCLPRFDSPPASPRCSTTRTPGDWVVAPPSRSRATSRRYLPGTLVLETTWESEDGTARVLDLMPRRTTTPTLIRIIEGVSGTVTFRSELRLRFDYGHVVPWVRAQPDGIEAIAGPDRVRVRTPAELRGEDWTTVADVTVRAGERVPFVLSWSPSHEAAPDPVDADAALDETVEFWREWSRPVHRRHRCVRRRRHPVADHPQGADVRADRGHRRRGDDLAPGGDRRVAQLGLPVLLAA